jgi:hypothetical protein
VRGGCDAGESGADDEDVEMGDVGLHGLFESGRHRRFFADRGVKFRHAAGAGVIL